MPYYLLFYLSYLKSSTHKMVGVRYAYVPREHLLILENQVDDSPDPDIIWGAEVEYFKDEVSDEYDSWSRIDRAQMFSLKRGNIVTILAAIPYAFVTI
jgi:hypothetical protein